MKCPSCQSNNPQSAKFCVECGNKFGSICPKCGISNSLAFKFCHECGSDLKSLKETISIDYSRPYSYTPKFLADKILTSRSSIEGERKLLTVLFADVANFTSISEKLDPEDVHQIMDGCFKILMDEIHQYEGTINQFTGDGVMALFGAPVAHEDHAQRACYAALSIQKAIAEFGPKVQKDYGADFKMRIGLNSGPVIVGSIGDDLRMDYTAVGDTTNLASRIEGMAKAGTSLVSSHSHKLTRDFFEFQALGKVQVKGKEEPQEIFELIKAGAVNTRIGASVAKGLTQFVGRKNSIATLMDSYNKARSGSGHVVGVVGDAGVGKSRLLLEFKKQLLQGEFALFGGQCLHFGSVMAYWPILDILRSYFEIKEGDQESLIKKKMEEKILRPDNELHGVPPPFHDLLSLQIEDEAYQKLDPVQKREETFEAIRDLLVRESQDRPIILVVEDLHWIDKTSEEFLSYLIEWLANTHILLVLLYRPEYTHTWGSKSHYTKIGLTQLTSQSSTELIQAILYDCEIEPGLETLILNRSAGTPLYIEELTHSLLENGSIQRKQNQCFLAIEPKDIQIPDTIQGIIAARMDRLEDNLKRTMQVASVIGRDFAFRILQTITGVKEELKSYLLNLQGLEFIYEKSLFPELEYIFKHALTQEVAYNSLLAARRKEIHERIGEAIEQIYAERPEEFYEMLAYHYDHGEVWEKAFLYLSRSGNKARLAYASQEAITHYTHAIEVSGRVTPALEVEELLPVYEGRGLVWLLLTNIDEAIADFQVMRQMARTSGNRDKEGVSLSHLALAHLQKFSEEHLPFVEQYAREAMRLSEQTGDQKLLAKGLASLGLAQQARPGDLAEASRNLEASVEISRREGFKEASSQSLSFLGLQAYWQGHFERAVSLCREGLAVSRDIHDGFHELLTLGNLAFAHWGVGDYGEAFRILHDGIRVARERDNGFGAGRMMNTLGWLHSEFGDVAHAMEYDQESAELGRTYRISNVEISALINLGLDHFLLGQHERALSYLEPTLDRVQREAFGAHRWRWKIRLLIGLAEIHYATAGYEQALRYVEDGLKEAQATSSQKYIAKGWALRGKIMAKLGDSDAAGAELQRAHTLAEQLHSPAIFYRTAYDLGQWYETAGQEQESAVLYARAKAAVEQMATAIEDEGLCAIFRKSAPVQAIYDCAVGANGLRTSVTKGGACNRKRDHDAKR
jgi:class 3 adenylate cyclase/tetratricopeptide (TPR) repeat protein